MKYDVIIVGAGPAGIFTALEMIKKGSKKSILMIDKGKDVKDKCKAGCIGCKKCTKTGCPAISYNKENKKAIIDKNQCLGCEVCAQVCPKEAIIKEVK